MKLQRRSWLSRKSWTSNPFSVLTSRREVRRVRKIGRRSRNELNWRQRRRKRIRRKLQKGKLMSMVCSLDIQHIYDWLHASVAHNLCKSVSLWGFRPPRYSSNDQYLSGLQKQWTVQIVPQTSSKAAFSVQHARLSWMCRHSVSYFFYLQNRNRLSDRRRAIDPMNQAILKQSLRMHRERLTRLKLASLCLKKRRMISRLSWNRKRPRKS